ncbi:hypothetical protein SHKM778_13870 [Streptomyces sp. KM77-8]|uniref:Uncharacterized protein n=1 Tax=Streptomyces haneummycinicus TaxID=3074435 RepID=A0AAT9HC77_9ACTN
MAIAGTVLSSLGLALWATALATGAVAGFWEGVKDATRADGVLTLAKGDCFDSPGGLEGWTVDVDRVPCARPHNGEVFAVVPLPDGRYPGEDGLTDIAEERCYDLRDAYVMDTWALPPRWRSTTCSRPGRAGTWATVRSPASSSGRTPATPSPGRCAGTRPPSTHTSWPIWKPWRARPRAGGRTRHGVPRRGSDGRQEWAGRVEETLAEQVRLLRAHTWPAGAEREMSDLAAQLDKAREEWGRRPTPPTSAPTTSTR